jgi:hypothetical protein
MTFTQILMRRRVRLNVDAVIAHVGKLFPRNRFPSS